MDEYRTQFEKFNTTHNISDNTLKDIHKILSPI